MGNVAGDRRPARRPSDRARPGSPARDRSGRVPDWRDGLFLAMSCAGFVAAVHASSSADAFAARPGDWSIPGMISPATLVDVSLPLLLGVAALCGPVIVRLRWQNSVLGLGLAWIGLVGLALLQERTFGHSFDVASCAIGYAVLVATGLLVKPGKEGSGPLRRPPRPPTMRQSPPPDRAAHCLAGLDW